MNWSVDCSKSRFLQHSEFLLCPEKSKSSDENKPTKLSIATGVLLSFRVWPLLFSDFRLREGKKYVCYSTRVSKANEK